MCNIPLNVIFIRIKTVENAFATIVESVIILKQEMVITVLKKHGNEMNQNVNRGCLCVMR